MKHIFAVMLKHPPNPSVVDRIKQHYHDHYSISPTCFIVESSHDVSVVSNAVGLSGDSIVEDAVGIAMKLNGTYSGNMTSDFWEWMDT